MQRAGESPAQWGGSSEQGAGQGLRVVETGIQASRGRTREVTPLETRVRIPATPSQ